MEAIGLDSRKMEFVKQILNESNAHVLEMAMIYFKKIKKTTLKTPCQMTLQELKTEVEQSVVDYENGHFITLEEFEKQVSSWK